MWQSYNYRQLRNKNFSAHTFTKSNQWWNVQCSGSVKTTVLGVLFTSFFKVLKEVNWISRKYCFVSVAKAQEMNIKYKKLLGWVSLWLIIPKSTLYLYSLKTGFCEVSVCVCKREKLVICKNVSLQSEQSFWIEIVWLWGWLWHPLSLKVAVLHPINSLFKILHCLNATVCVLLRVADLERILPHSLTTEASTARGALSY